MDFETLKTGFLQYLKDKHKTSRNNSDKFDNLDADSSIFLYAADFKQYIKKINSENNLNLSLNGEISADDEISQILAALSAAQDDTIQNNNDLMAELMNSFLTDENVKNTIDENNDGILSSDEISNYIRNNGSENESLTFDDLTKLFGDIQSKSDTTTSDSSSGASSVSAGSSAGSSGGGYVPSANDSSGSQSGDDTSVQSIENMSAEQLEAKLQEANGELTAANSELAEYQNGTKPDSSAMDTAYEAYTKAIGEEKTAELEAIKTEITNKEAEITTKTNEIVTQMGVVATAQQTYDTACNKYNSLTSKKSQLESALSSASEDKKSEIQSQINSIEGEIAQADRDKTDAKTALDEANAELERKNGEKTTLEGELEALNNKLLEKENEITGDDKQLKLLQEAYDTAKAEYDAAKAEGLKTALDTIDTKLKEISAIKTQQQKLKDDSKINTDYPTTENNIPADIVQALDSKLGAGFCAKVAEVAVKIGCAAQDLLAVMSFESGISPSIVNKSSGATGLIQFMPGVAKGLGTTTAALRNMSAIEQMEYVEKYLVSRKQANLPNKEKLNAGDVYSLVFLPAYANQEELCHRGGKYYGSNAGLDRDHDGRITKTDLNNAAWGAYKNVMKKMGVDIAVV